MNEWMMNEWMDEWINNVRRLQKNIWMISYDKSKLILSVTKNKTKKQK